MLRWIGVLGVSLFSCGAALAEPVVYCFDRLIDGDGTVLAGNEIAVEDGVIIAIGKNLKGERVNLRHLIAVPGLIDAHTHITYGLDGPSKGNGWAELGEVADERRVAIAAENGRKTLRTGVTTIRDLNAIGKVDLELRAMIEAGEVTGPRIITSGNAIHPGIQPPEDGSDATDPDFVGQSARNRIAAGSDWIKIFATTGSADDLTSTAYYPPEAIKAAADVAHELGKRITIHSYGPEAVDAGIAAGVDSIDHPVGMTPSQIDGLRENNIIYVPTIDHNRYYKDHADEYGYDAQVQGNLDDFVARNIETVRRAHAAGVVIAMGSDAVMSGFGDNTCELLAFREAGMSNVDALKTATVNGAQLLGMEDRLGRLAVGYSADIVAVSGDPLADISNLVNSVAWVMKAGELVLDETALAELPRPNCGAGF